MNLVLGVELKDFLVKAKKATYGSGAEPDVSPDGTKELTYAEGRYIYRDRYYCFDPFIGEELVIVDGKPVWGMNYYGKVTSSEHRPEEVYGFLVKALSMVPREKPFRGLEEYEKGAWRYEAEIIGDVHCFHGRERIICGGVDAYWLRFHGGSVG